MIYYIICSESHITEEEDKLHLIWYLTPALLWNSIPSICATDKTKKTQLLQSFYTKIENNQQIGGGIAKYSSPNIRPADQVRSHDSKPPRRAPRIRHSRNGQGTYPGEKVRK